MATSVKIDEETKDRLEQLQARVKLETGRKVTQQELLDRIVAGAFDSQEALIDSFGDEWEGYDETTIDRWFAGPTVTATTTGDTADDTLYGDSYLEKKLGLDSAE